MARFIKIYILFSIVFLCGSHFRDEDSIPAEEIRVTERWSIKEIEPPDYR